MSLTSGTRIGAYEIVSALGAGGMGEVYRARDTRLNRDVAIKILPEAFAADPDRLMRFEREAQTLAALNHPNIAQIHGLEESGATRALVMELVDGEDLSQRIARGSIPIDEALPIGRQIADALGAAHDAGIIHRDLKPANIKVRRDGTVKVLDFGLAKAMEGDGFSHRQSAEAKASALQTVTSPAMTMAGVILGTAAYMSPEQVKGKPANKQSDIWAFGVVLYEMLTGRTMFAGASMAETFAEVLKRDIDWSALPAATATSLRRALRRCLERDPRRRMHDISDVLIELSDTSEDVAHRRETPAWRIAFLVAACVAVVAVAGVIVIWRVQSGVAGPASAIQFEWHESAAVPWESGRENTAAPFPAVSPDGKLVAFVRVDEHNARHVWVRGFDSLEARRIEGTDIASRPFWSPDSSAIGFVSGGGVQRVALDGTGAQTIGKTIGGTGGRGGRWGCAWSSSDVILCANIAGDMFTIPAAGGVPTPLSLVTHGKQMLSVKWPAFLGSSESFVALDGRTAFLGTLGSSELIELMPADTRVVYSAGHLLFGREGKLWAQTFDLASHRLGGAAKLIANLMPPDIFNEVALSASPEGVVIFKSAGSDRTRLLQLDRSGKELAAYGPPNASFLNPSVSKNGLSAAVAIRSGNATYDIWTIDLRRGTQSRFTFGTENEFLPSWSADHQHIVFSGGRDGTDRFYRKRVDGAGQEEQLDGRGVLNDWSWDGRYILWRDGEGLKYSSGKGPATIYLARRFNEDHPTLSPDGKWLAYSANASGRQEVYVRSFPDPSGGTRQISYEGGREPRWRSDGKELYYARMGNDDEIRATRIDGGGSNLQVGDTVTLFKTRLAPGSISYAAAPDGTWFLVNTPVAAATVPLTVILNWPAVIANNPKQ